jgi:hypothetical protein
MDAVALALVFVGAFMLYEAIKNPNPTPIKKVTDAITNTAPTGVNQKV